MNRQRAPSITGYTRPYAVFHDRYQEYYREGLRQWSQRCGGRFKLVPMTRFSKTLGLLRRTRDRGPLSRVIAASSRVAAAVDRAAFALEGFVDSPSGLFGEVTGQYIVVTESGSVRRVCIDSSDYSQLDSEELANWSDVYFKTNRWPSVAYPPNVLPLQNADPLILPYLNRLRQARRHEKRYDLCFVVRVWGGSSGVEGVEHNLRLLEAVRSSKANAFVLALLVIGEIDCYARYLERRRIPWTTRSLAASELWSLAASSRLNIIRLGMHYCVPWRMTGALAAGACVVLDRSPLSEWPIALRRDVNFLSLDVEVGPGEPVAEPGAYAGIPEKLEEWLAQPERLRAISEANAVYFDEYLHPLRVGNYVMSRVAADSAEMEEDGRCATYQ